jgi:putative transposase
MIEEFAEKFAIKELCEAMGVSRSGYYEWKNPALSKRERENKEIDKAIEELHQEHRQRLGSPRMTHHLREKGIRCGRHRVARLMRAKGVRARRKKPFRPKTTTPGKKAFANLLRDINCIDKPNQVWVSDITYVPTLEGDLYLATVLDLFSRKIVGWKLADTMEATLVEEAIKRAVRRENPENGIYFHSDRGVQYSSAQVRRTLRVIGARQSMSGKGNCYDNAFAESFFSTLKAECFPSKLVFTTKQEAKLAIFEYIEGYYNNHRLHSSLGYTTPEEFQERYKNIVAKNRQQSRDTSAD